ncbi:hypothetical protein [Ulvibacter antarcticus]|uniref:Uncharacterized protein n=1 Tax=Ulvibacter antarcticus TaxID=442714 RepID=A0A3L9YUT5_9FLAO|nr:hypothetical protein [Ulvibacter antarcticus]RMA64426.1 hypothetical protein BXY75_1301 [Ulvibacter antarcticus]
MKQTKDCNRDELKINRLLRFRLPNVYKKIGWVLFFITFATILSTKFFEGDLEVLKIVLRKIMLVTLLIVVLSKEKIEDEMITNFRAKSFSVAFIVGVFYVLLQPVVNFIVALILSEDKPIFENLGDFQILWFMLIVYLTVFWVLKRNA